MITYEVEKSPFFEANKAYAEKIEAQLKSINAECSGYCNSFGYEIESSFKRNNLLFNVLFKKQQSTQNGVVIPVNARDDFETNVSVSGFSTPVDINFGKSTIKRAFLSSELKTKIPTPFFIKFNKSTPPQFIDLFIEKSKEIKLSEAHLNKNKFEVKLHEEISRPLHIIETVELLIKNSN
jgi:hypothetical protein